MRRLILILAVLGCICLVVVVAAGMFLVAQERAEVRENYGEEVAKLCDPPSGGVANAANMPAADGGLQVLALEEGDALYHDFHEDLPDDLRADDADELDVVACVSGQDITVESCDYMDENDDTKKIGTVNRIQKALQVILINPDGNLRIAELQIKGGMPGECEDGMTFSREGETKSINGADVTYNDFEVALRNALGQ